MKLWSASQEPPCLSLGGKANPPTIRSVIVVPCVVGTHIVISLLSSNSQMRKPSTACQRVTSCHRNAFGSDMWMF